MAVSSPQQMHPTFQQAFNDGDVDALMALYEPGAAVEGEPGQVANGTDQIREALGGFLALKGTMNIETRKVIEAGDLAFLRGHWTLKGTGPDGNPVEMEGNNTEVLRRQPDGSWLHALDLPNDF